ncbi:MAG: hypothetical protein ACK560_07885 [Bacteroidota bacterium]|jgi:hypothetical protein
MKGNQPELRFVSNFPKEDTLQLLLDAHTLYLELREEKQRNLHVSLEEAATLLDFPVRKVQQLIQEGHLKQSKDGSVSRYHVVRVLFELKQAELFNSIG